jgi:hypothetical protein
METGSASDDVALVRQRGASFADDCVELLDGSDMFVDDGLIDERPQGLRRRTSTIVRSTPARASRAKTSSSAAKKGFETPSCTYQKVSPLAGETTAVT